MEGGLGGTLHWCKGSSLAGDVATAQPHAAHTVGNMAASPLRRSLRGLSRSLLLPCVARTATSAASKITFACPAAPSLQSACLLAGHCPACLGCLHRCALHSRQPFPGPYHCAERPVRWLQREGCLVAGWRGGQLSSQDGEVSWALAAQLFQGCGEACCFLPTGICHAATSPALHAKLCCSSLSHMPTASLPLLSSMASGSMACL